MHPLINLNFCVKKIYYDLLSRINISTTLYGDLEIKNILNISDGVKLTLYESKVESLTANLDTHTFSLTTSEIFSVLFIYKLP